MTRPPQTFTRSRDRTTWCSSSWKRNFFFQAEDGIRDVAVTGVQTCALPICPYYWPNVRIRTKAVATNVPPHGAFRGFGAPQSLFAMERHMDRIAQAVGLSPIEEIGRASCRERV